MEAKERMEIIKFIKKFLRNVLEEHQ